MCNGIVHISVYVVYQCPTLGCWMSHNLPYFASLVLSVFVMCLAGFQAHVPSHYNVTPSVLDKYIHEVLLKCAPEWI